MNEIDKLYGAYIRFPIVAGEVEFNYSEIQIKKQYAEMVEVDHFYFTSSSYSTKYFDKNMIDKEYKISDSITCYYSAEKQKCIDWLTDKRNDLIKCYKYDYERLLKSEVKESVIKL